MQNCSALRRNTGLRYAHAPLAGASEESQAPATKIAGRRAMETKVSTLKYLFAAAVASAAGDRR